MRMTLSMSLIRPAGDRVQEVTVGADPGDTARDLAQALHRTLAGPDTAPPDALRLVVDGRPVPDDAPVGMPPLLCGACVQVLDGPAAAPSTRTHPGAALRLDVTAGPDAGRSIPLATGRHVLGRGADCDLTVADPGMSRRHAVVEVSAEGIRITDLGSTNGTLLAGGPVHSAPLPPGVEVVAGGTRLLVRPATDTAPVSRTAAGDGTWTIHRSPSLPGRPVSASFELPRPPLAPVPARIPWLAMLLPLPVCLVLAYFWGPQLLAFALLGPLVSGGTAWADRRSGARRHAAELAAYDAERQGVRESLASALSAERAGLRAAHPDAAEVLRTALGPSRRLWERDPRDPVVLRLGTGEVVSETVLVDPATHRPEPQPLPDAPVLLDLAGSPVLGVCGSPSSRDAVCRHLLGQIAVRHSPADVEVAVLEPDEELAWVGWLPHVQAGPGPAAEVVAAMVTRLDAGADGQHAPRRGPHAAASGGADTGGERTDRSSPLLLVLLPDMGRLRHTPGLDALLAHAGSGRCLAVAVADTAADLPPQCRAVLELAPGDAPGQAVLTVAGERPQTCAVDGASREWAWRIARALAPLRDPRSTLAELPRSTTLETALGFDIGNPVALRQAWQAGRGLDAVVGARADGPHHVDLVVDGPHALVGGTTGSGKSELLRSLVAGLAAHHSPAEVSFVLVDYKGGAAFRECAELPHTAALVTDLDPHLARRALVGLTAELRHRETVLATTGARDLQEYNDVPGAAGRLPRLVIVVDELKMLVEELPDFVEGLVRLAALGRSLGLHLVLATQRPAGAVTADIQANVNLRIALRVRDRIDSEHVLGAADAALLPEDVPGRAVMSTGSGSLVTFQTAHPGAMTSRVRGVTVGLPDQDRPLRAANDGPTDLARLVASARAAARDEDHPSPRAPWLPPLPESIPRGTLPAPGRDGGVVLGLVDDPARQSQHGWTWAPESAGVLGVVGSAASGRTTLVRTLVASLAPASGPPPVHVYVVDGGRSLGCLEALPHVGVVVDPADGSRLRSLVSRLSDEVRDRTRLLAEAGLTRLEEWRCAEPATSPPWLLLVLDGWDALADAALTDHDLVTVLEQLRALLEEGRAAGLLGVVTGGRPLLVGAAARMCTSRVLLGRVDPTEAALLGLPRQADAARPPGRGLLLEDALEVQLAHLGADASGAAQTAAVRSLSARLPPPATSGSRPFAVGSVPTRVAAEELPVSALLLVGRGEDGAPMGLDPDRDGRRLLVAGPRGSGRTTALVTIAVRCADAGMRVLHVGLTGDRSAPLDARGAARLRPDEVDRLVAAHRADPRIAVVVDDADRLVGTPMDTALSELAGRVERDGGLLVCAAESTTLGTLFRGAVVEVARARTGLLLDPSGPLDGDVFGVRVPRAPGRHPGRGHLVARGSVAPLQVAHVHPVDLRVPA